MPHRFVDSIRVVRLSPPGHPIRSPASNGRKSQTLAQPRLVLQAREIYLRFAVALARPSAKPGCTASEQLRDPQPLLLQLRTRAQSQQQDRQLQVQAPLVPPGSPPKLLLLPRPGILKILSLTCVRHPDARQAWK